MEEEKQEDVMIKLETSPFQLQDRLELVGIYSFQWPKDEDVDRTLSFNRDQRQVMDQEFELSANQGDDSGRARNMISAQQPDFHQR